MSDFSTLELAGIATALDDEERGREEQETFLT